MGTANRDEFSRDVSPHQANANAEVPGSSQQSANEPEEFTKQSASSAQPSKSPERSTDERQEDYWAQYGLKPASATLQQLQEQKVRKLTAVRYNPEDTYIPREWVIQGLAALLSMVGFIGPEKAQKSVMVLRLAMYIACGRDFCGFRVPKARRVVYFDAENPPDEIDLRYKAMLKQFSPGEQALIEKNLVIIKGRELINQGENIEVDNEIFWKAFVATYPAEVYILDALQMFHSANTISNRAIKDVLLRLRAYCGPDNCLIILHHTRKREDREITRRKPVRLREIGPRVWSDKCLGAGVFKRLADVIVCQELAEERDHHSGEVIDSTVDLGAFGRIIEDTPLLRFRLGEDYWLELVRDLSPSAQASYEKLRREPGTGSSSPEDGGPWPSKNAAAKVLGLSRSQGNAHVNELIGKGYLRVDDRGWVHLV